MMSFVRWMLVAAVLAVGIHAGYPSIEPRGQELPPLLKSAGDTLRIQLVDAVSGAPLANTDVKVESDNGIRCVRAPCDTNAQTWTGRTDGDGYLNVPRTAVQAHAYFEVPLYRTFNLRTAERKGTSWSAELTPEAVARANDLGVHELKVLDAVTGRAIANEAVQVVGGGRVLFEAPTSARGYLFIPLEQLAGHDRVSIAVRGYRTKRHLWDPPRDVVRLQPE